MKTTRGCALPDTSRTYTALLGQQHWSRPAGPGHRACWPGEYTGKWIVDDWGVTMTGLVRMSFDSPEEVRPFESGMGQVEVVNIKEGGVGRGTFQPGWKWSEHIKPIAQTDSCQAAHMGYFMSGRMKVVSDDGEEMEYGPGDFGVIPPGHDAGVVGDGPSSGSSSSSAATYARQRT